MKPSTNCEGAAVSSACAADIPLIPPSPYKPGAHPLRARPSTLPSLFANKIGIISAVDDTAAKDREAVREVEMLMARRAAPPASVLATCTAVTARPSDTAAVALTQLAETAPATVQQGVLTGTREASMSLALFFVVKCRQLESDESTAREGLIAEAEHQFLQAEMMFLESRQRLLAETLGTEKYLQLAMLQREKAAREEARDVQFRLIEEAVAHESRERRLGEALQKKIDSVFPQYLADRATIEEEEQEALRAVFLWHTKNRPLGPGCFIKGPEEDPRVRYGSLTKPRKPTAEVARTIASAKARSESYKEQLRKRAATALIVVDSDTEAEMSYAAEGRRMLQDEKLRLHEHIRRTRALEYLAEEEQKERVEVQHEEAQAYASIAAFGVDNLYKVRAFHHSQELERQRQRALAVAARGDDEQNDDALRARIRAQLTNDTSNDASLDSAPAASESGKEAL